MYGTQKKVSANPLKKRTTVYSSGSSSNTYNRNKNDVADRGSSSSSFSSSSSSSNSRHRVNYPFVSSSQPKPSTPTYDHDKPFYSGFQVIQSGGGGGGQSSSPGAVDKTVGHGGGAVPSSKSSQDFHSPPPLPPYLTSMWSSSSPSSPSKDGGGGGGSGSGVDHSSPYDFSSSYHSPSFPHDRNDHYNPIHHTFAGTSHRFSQHQVWYGMAPLRACPLARVFFLTLTCHPDKGTGLVRTVTKYGVKGDKNHGHTHCSPCRCVN